jgi:hypothetical protein
MPPATAERPTKLGIIEAGAVYPLPIFQQLTGLSVWAMRQARNRGLRVRIAGRRKYVVGSDWLTYLEQSDNGADS